MNLKIKQNAFTLFELLVVVSIIGILVALGTVAYSNAQKKARDSKAKSDIKAMSDSMEQYYVENNEYPSSCDAVAGDTWQGVWPPNDPRGRASDHSDYAYSGVANTDCSSAGYCFCAELEAGSGGNASNADCSSWASDGAYYCITQQQ